MKTVGVASIRAKLVSRGECTPAEVERLRKRFPDLVRWLREHGHDGKLILPMPPNLANADMHHIVRRATREEYLSQVHILATLSLLPAPPATPPQRVEVTATMVLYAEMDEDNALSRCKWACDALVHRGFAVDDKRKHLRWAGLPAQIVDRRQPSRIEFEIEEVPDEC